MSDYKAAQTAAAVVLEHIERAEAMALPGSHEHYQFVSAQIMVERERIKFILRVLLEN